jgi:3-hydroxyisobutyrate dehydrogenase
LKIGMLWLGKMGAGIASNLLKAAHEVVIWNRSAEKAKPLVALGATSAATPRQAAAGRDFHEHHRPGQRGSIET